MRKSFLKMLISQLQNILLMLVSKLKTFVDTLEPNDKLKNTTYNTVPTFDTLYLLYPP